jgi:hypothetical protein
MNAEQSTQQNEHMPNNVVSLNSYNLTDLGNAKRFADQHSVYLRYVTSQQKWYIYDGKRWAEDELSAVYQLADMTIQSMYEEAARCSNQQLRRQLTDHAQDSESRRGINNMLALAATRPGIACTITQFDRDQMVFNVQNGTIDLRTGQFKAHDSRDMLTKIANVTYNPYVECSTWLAFLNRIMSGNEDTIRFLQRAVGYSLTGKTNEQCLFFLYGTGAKLPAVEALLRHEQGGVCAPCGSGKTVMGLAAIAQARQPALWVTHTKELAQQTISRAVDVFGLERDEIGYIGSGKFTIGTRLTVALVQTLAKRDLSEILDKFGCVVVDEAHHMAARSFYDTVGQFPARYRFWLSATPERSDGLTPMIVACGGDIVHNIPRAQVPTITPSLVVVETKYDYQHDNYTTLMSNLTNNYPRNELIAKIIAKHAKGHYSLVLSDRLDHLRRLKAMLRDKLPDMTIEFLHGGLPKKQREEVMERARNKQTDILLATNLAREGLDLPHLDRLFLTTPKRSASTVQQECGRVMRPCEGKTDAVVFDFRDARNGMLDWQFNKRCQVCQKLGMQWHIRDVKQVL